VEDAVVLSAAVNGRVLVLGDDTLMLGILLRHLDVLRH